MRSNQFEYFATHEDQLDFWSKIDADYDLKIVETVFDKGNGPKVFEGLVRFLDFMRKDADFVARRGLYYGTFDPQKLQSTSNRFSDKLASFDLIRNPDVLTFNYGDRLDDKRLLISQIGCSKESLEAKKLLLQIKKAAKAVVGEAGVTVTGEFVFGSAAAFAKDGGRLVRTPDSPPLYDAQIAC